MRKVTGWPVITIRRGEVVFQDDQVMGAPGSGQLVVRGQTQAAQLTQRK